MCGVCVRAYARMCVFFKRFLWNLICYNFTKKNCGTVSVFAQVVRCFKDDLCTYFCTHIEWLAKYRVRQKEHRFGRGIASGGERVQWWGARRRTAVYVPFSVYTMAWLGEHRAFVVEEFIKNGGSPVATRHAFRIRFALGWREAVPDKKTIYRWVSNFRQTGQTLEALK